MIPWPKGCRWSVHEAALLALQAIRKGACHPQIGVTEAKGQGGLTPPVEALLQEAA